MHNKMSGDGNGSTLISGTSSGSSTIGALKVLMARDKNDEIELNEEELLESIQYHLND